MTWTPVAPNIPKLGMQHVPKLNPQPDKGLWKVTASLETCKQGGPKWCDSRQVYGTGVIGVCMGHIDLPKATEHRSRTLCLAWAHTDSGPKGLILTLLGDVKRLQAILHSGVPKQRACR